MSQTLHFGDTEVDKAELTGLCRQYQVRELSLFGSAARGEMRPGSEARIEERPQTAHPVVGAGRRAARLCGVTACTSRNAPVVRYSDST